jgi:crotonobetainyl-CoA:carnitine CoA-transferase CaiB-like acyl-CoA transferase
MRRGAGLRPTCPPLTRRTPSPVISSHTTAIPKDWGSSADEILRDWGFSADEVADLHHSGAVASAG